MVELIRNSKCSINWELKDWMFVLGSSIGGNIGSVVDDDYGGVNDENFWWIQWKRVQPWWRLGAYFGFFGEWIYG